MATKTFAWPPRNDHLLLIYADEVLIRQVSSLFRLVDLDKNLDNSIIL